MKTRNRNRRVAPRTGYARPRSLSTFKREVTALLVVTYRYPSARAVRLVKTFSKYVRLRWSKGVAPCAVADHLQKWERERVLTGRDAENPKEGEVFESRNGTRWRVTELEGEKKVKVERAGHRQSGKLTWNKGAIRGMREVEGEKKQLSLFGSDPGRPRKNKGKKRPGKARGATALRPKRKVVARGKAKSSGSGKRTSVTLTIRFSRARFTPAKAKRWLRHYGKKSGSMDTTVGWYWFRQLPTRSVKVYGSKEIAPGIVAVFGRKR